MTSLSDDLPAWTGYEGQEPSSFPQSLPSLPARPLITTDALQRHLDTHPAPWRTLPDGRPLRLTAAAIEFIVDDFGGYRPDEVRSAHRVLYFASRTDAEMAALWIPSVPRVREDDGDHGGGAGTALALSMHHLQSEISAWAAVTFEPGTFHLTRSLAFQLWTAIVDRMPVSAQKKSQPPPPPEESAAPASDPSTSPTSPGFLADQTPSATITFSPGSTSSPSSPPSSAGTTSAASPASPSQSAPDASPPSAPDSAVWVAETVKHSFNRRHFATGNKVCGSEGVTPELPDAVKFPNESVARAWISACCAPDAFRPVPIHTP